MNHSQRCRSSRRITRKTMFKQKSIDCGSSGYEAFLSLSANQTFIIDCLVTPRRLASSSRESTIQFGRSTLTRFCERPGRTAFERSRCSEIFSPLSNFLSNSLAFIYQQPTCVYIYWDPECFLYSLAPFVSVGKVLIVFPDLFSASRIS